MLLATFSSPAHWVNLEFQMLRAVWNIFNNSTNLGQSTIKIDKRKKKRENEKRTSAATTAATTTTTSTTKGYNNNIRKNKQTNCCQLCAVVFPLPHFSPLPTLHCLSKKQNAKSWQNYAWRQFLTFRAIYSRFAVASSCSSAVPLRLLLFLPLPGLSLFVCLSVLSPYYSHICWNECCHCLLISGHTILCLFFISRRSFSRPTALPAPPSPCHLHVMHMSCCKYVCLCVCVLEYVRERKCSEMRNFRFWFRCRK